MCVCVCGEGYSRRVTRAPKIDAWGGAVRTLGDGEINADIPSIYLNAVAAVFSLHTIVIIFSGHIKDNKMI